MPATILVVENDCAFSALLSEFAGAEAYRVLVARDAVELLHRLGQHAPDLVLLDAALPCLDGCEACREIRQVSDVPIILVCGQGDVTARVRGLELGADAVLSRPVSARELAAQVRATLRRGRGPIEPERVVHVDERLCVDRARGEVRIGGRRVELSPIEFKLLSCFVDQPGRLLAHHSLLTQVWGWEYANESGYLKVYIHNLRKKIEPDPAAPRYIITERGLGYRFQAPALTDS